MAPLTYAMAPPANKPGHAPVHASLLVAPLLAAPILVTSALPLIDGGVVCALAAIIALGVPHGALDGEVAHDLLQPRFGRAWFAVFALPYLTLSVLVLLAWHVAPLITLASFLLASVLHFGMEESASSLWLERVARGGLPVALPTLLHPAATAALFATVIGRPLPTLPLWWLIAALAWIAISVTWLAFSLRRDGITALAQPSLLALSFLVLPPLTAFALYFICVHAPAHMAGLIRSGRALRVTDAGAAWQRAAPVTLLTLLLGGLLWPLFSGPSSSRLLALTVQGLAALTLPHMLLEGFHDRLRRLVEGSDQPGVERPWLRGA